MGSSTQIDEDRHPERAHKAVPQRMCAGCRERHPASGLVRFVKNPEGRIVIDIRQRAPARGAYLSASERCVTAALKRRALQRALDGRLDEGDAEELLRAMRGALETRALERLGLARRAGRVASGSEPVREAMKHDRAILVWVAADASEGTRSQLVRNAVRKGLPVVVALDGSALARAIGMDYVAAVAITGEPFASELLGLSSSLEDSWQGSGR